MKRAAALSWICLLGLAVVGSAHATEEGCRRKVAPKAAALYAKIAKSFAKCSAALALGKPCDVPRRDAKNQGSLAKTRTGVLAGCDAATAVALGFADNGSLAVRVAGVAAGEGRGIADAIYGRDPAPLAPDLATCAKVLASQDGKAGKTLIKTLVPCGAVCGSTEQGKVDTAFARAAASIGKSCGPAQLAALVGGDLAAHLAAVRAGAQRVVASILPGVNPVVSVVAPAPGSILTPPGLPASVGVGAVVSNLPSAAYVTSLEVNGLPATFNPGNNRFERTLVVSTPKATVPLFLRARTTFGTVSTTGVLRFDLASVSPGVVITLPATGTITGAASVAVSGQVIGNRAAADVLLVAGAPTPFNPSTGAFTTSVALGPQAVNVVRATVQSVALGTADTDSTVVLRGSGLALGQRVPTANTNRLNNSGFVDVAGIIRPLLDAAFDPANFIGLALDDGTISQFSTGTKTSTVFAGGANTVTVRISINNFHVRVNDVGAGCDAVYDANNILIDTQANLFGQLQVAVNTNAVTFTGDDGELIGGILCDLIDIFTDVRDRVRDALTDELNSRLPDAFNAGLSGINISGPIGSALDVNIDAVYANIVEDAAGVTFLVDSNISALNPIPDAPPISATLLPVSAGPPVFGPTAPGTSTPFDLGFCLSDGFVNRAMAAFMLQGKFNQSLTQVPFGGGTVTLTTPVVSALLGDPAYDTACPGCNVTLVLKPTAAAVARGPAPGQPASVVLTIPNYRLDMVADLGGTPIPLVSANVTFDLPLTLAVATSQIVPTAGAVSVLDVRVTDNPIAANEGAFATQVATLFPLAAQALGALFGDLPLPEFQGLAVTGVGSGYNVSCTALYLNLQ